MYQALYRKYRPKTLEDVCGQDTIVTILKNSIKSGKINHAYLFAGPRGTGKTSVAKIFAKIVNCENLVNCIPCNKCTSCTQVNNSDIIEIDAASNNGVDEIRELRNNVNLVPSYGKYKVYIIDEVHMLTTGAFNALLKTLEEPPAHIIFILATTDPHKIPETILSRCQRLDFKKISNKAIVENLRKISKLENIEIEEEALNEIAQLSDGGMRDSVGMLDQANAYSSKKISIKDIHDINGTIVPEDMKNIIEYIFNNNLDKILENIDKYNDKGKNFVKLTEELITFIRNILLFKKAPEYFKNTQKNIEIYEKLPNIEVNQLLRYIEILNKYSFEMKNNNNTKLLLELALIKIISEDKPVNISNKENEQKTIKKESEIKIQNPNKNLQKQNDQTYEEPQKKLIVEKQDDNYELKKKIKQIRIDNTLSNFSKRHLMEILPNLENLNNMLLDPDYSSIASMILDGKLKAASDEYLIFVYKNERLANLFNENILSIENLLERTFGKKYKIIATDIEDWEKIKLEFNKKTRKFEYVKENFNLEEILGKNKNNSIENMFEEIIEYN